MSNTRCRIIRLLAGLGVVTAIPFFALAENSIDINFDNSGSQSATQKAPAVSQPSTATEASQAGLGGPAVESVAVSGENRQTNVIISGKELRKPSVRKIEGQKLVVQFPGTTLKIPSRIEEKDHLVTAIRSSDHEGTAWVVLDTHGFKKWKIRKNSTGYVLTLFSRGLPARTVSSVPPQVEASGAGESSSEGKKTIARLTDLSLKPMEGGLKVVLTSDGPAKYTVRKLVQPEKLAIRFHGALLEISDKDAKLKEAKGFQKQGLLLLELRQIGPRYSPLSEALLTLLPGTTHQVSRDLNQVVITLTAPPAFGKTVEKKGSLDQLVSIDLEGADLTAVLKTLGSEAGFNVDFANPVVGVVNEKLKDVPLRNALALLLGPGSYDYEVQGGTIRIGTQATLRATKVILPHVTKVISPTGGMTPSQFDALVRGILRPTNASVSTFDTTRNVVIVSGTPGDVEDYKRTIRDLELDGGNGSDGRGDRITRVVKLNYADPAQMVTLLTPYLTPVGHVQADTRTGSLVLWESSVNMGVLLELVKVIDVKPPQVLIESNIVEVDNENDLNLGVNWTADKPTGDPTLNGRVFLPPTNVQAVPGAFTFGTLKSGFNINATLHALETRKNGKIISRPRIATASGLAAEINTVENVVFQTQIQSVGLGGVIQTTNVVNTLPLPISLSVTPRITDDGRITTQMAVSVTSVSGPALANAPPPTNIQMAHTTITTKNGETIVIGGLVRDVSQETVNGIPILSSIPIIGTLFQQKEKDIRKEELVIFITPTLLED